MTKRTHRVGTAAAVALLGCGPFAPLPAQACPNVRDINSALTPYNSNPNADRIGPGGTAATTFVQIGSTHYFTATTAAAGEELWKTDGTPGGTVMVKDIHPGPAGAAIAHLTACSGKLFFRADGGTDGTELWVSDGTAAGTTQVSDIRPGAASSTPAHFACLNGKVYFTANDGTRGSELWTSDGTAANTKLVADIRSGPTSSSIAYLRAVPSRNIIVFRANNGASGLEVFRTDGTAAGTRLLRDINPGTASSSPIYFFNVGGVTVFRALDPATGTELWKTDGTPAGTVLVRDINPGTASSTPQMATAAVHNGMLFFGANNGGAGTELWRTDGTTAGTLLAADVNTGTFGSNPGNILSLGNDVIFAAANRTNGREIFKLSGNTVTLLRDITPGTNGSNPLVLSAFGNRALFVANDTVGRTGFELYITDGTPAGTRLLKDINSGSGSSVPLFFTQVAATKCLFTAIDPSTTNGRELFETDGTSAGTRLFKDLDPGGGTGNSNPANLATRDGEKLVFAANDGTNGTELWLADRNGATLLKDIRPGSLGSSPSRFATIWTGTTTLTLFRATDAAGAELWRTDGTSAGTVRVKDIRPGALGSSPNHLTPCGDKVFFAANNGTNGVELWVSDGTAAGTVLVADVRPGSSSSSPTNFKCVGSNVFFTAVGPNIGRELYVASDLGVTLLKDIRPGSTGSSPAELTAVGDTLVFRADDGTLGAELWISDGTPGGTELLHDTRPGTASGSPTSLTVCGDKLFFAANNGTHGIELWRSDLSPFGTEMLRDIRAGGASSSPTNLVASGDRLFFSALLPGTGMTGRELYASDGTPTGTGIVADIYAGTTSSSPTNLIAAGGGVYFTAVGAGTGRELYHSDGSSVGTRMVCDLASGSGSSSPTDLRIVDGKLFFRATTPRTGVELFSIREQPATAEILGTGCGVRAPSLQSTDPVLGGSLTVTGRNAPGGVALLVLGLPSQPSAPGLVAAGCALRLDLRFPVVIVPHPAGSKWSMRLPVTSNSTLLGTQIGIQGAYAPTPLTLSNAVKLTVGR